MQNGVGAGSDGEGLCGRGEAGSRDFERVDADGDLGKFEFAIRNRGDAWRVNAESAALQSDLRAGDGAVLRIVDDAVKGGEDSGTRKDRAARTEGSKRQ